MKRKMLLLLLTAVLPINYVQADNRPLSTHLQPLADIFYEIPITPLPSSKLEQNNLQLIKTQSSLDRIKSDLMKSNMRYIRYFLKKDIIKKNGMRPVIRSSSITFHYTYRW